MSVRWYSTVFDCRDVVAQAHWWAQLLDWRVTEESAEGAVVAPPADGGADPSGSAGTGARGSGPRLVFVPVPERKTVKNRLHLDLAPPPGSDRAAEVERLLGLGARRVDLGQVDPDVDVFADPEGNEFCLLSEEYG
ncbi:VOC family protein [Streptomyces lonarensis]|uniref:VOC family protein n=1 Tax=Streptomyces lonarensis TaxID=700599 RepID=A0A7X6HX17_9ACTN|nr:VOC family protein [Streptomyces lonarensis]NJQ04063.1 VOC family protein [Streptomyces lonarensis]